MPSPVQPAIPELLYLLAGDDEDFLAACENLLPADAADALNKLPVPAAARGCRRPAIPARGSTTGRARAGATRGHLRTARPEDRGPP